MPPPVPEPVSGWHLPPTNCSFPEKNYPPKKKTARFAFAGLGHARGPIHWLAVVEGGLPLSLLGLSDAVSKRLTGLRSDPSAWFSKIDPVIPNWSMPMTLSLGDVDWYCGNWHLRVCFWQKPFSGKAKDTHLGVSLFQRVMVAGGCPLWFAFKPAPDRIQPQKPAPAISPAGGNHKVGVPHLQGLQQDGLQELVQPLPTHHLGRRKAHVFS